VFLSGYVRDAATGEALINATVADLSRRVGTYTNAYGYYSLPLSGDSATLTISYVGYLPQRKRLALTADLRLDVVLAQADLDEVVITDNLARRNVEEAVMGVIDLPIEQVEALPYLMGEKDLFKSLQLLPGVQSAGEATSGFLVRGGQPDQNLVLMDEAIVYNPFHLAGYVSVFNTDAIRSVTLYKGSFPARYGGRLSSIVDVSMKEGNNQEFHGKGGIGVISAHAMIEGPIIKERASFMIAARRSYVDLLIKPFQRFGREQGYQFTDVNGKVNLRLSPQDRLYLSGYYGGDNLVNDNIIPTVDTFRSGVKWGNTTFTLRWNHLFGSRMFVNTSVIYSDYTFRASQYSNGSGFQVQSGIRDWQVKSDFELTPAAAHHVTFGASYQYHRFTPHATNGSLQVLEVNPAQPRYVHEAGVYLNDEWSLGPRFGVNVGLRAPLFWDPKGTVYYSLEPRATLKYQLDDNSSVKGGYTYMNQYSHLVNTSAVALPFDLWVPSSQVVKPQIAQQVAVGYFRNWLADRYESSVEVYYKHMRNLIDYRQGADFFFENNIEQELVFGDGWSYGAEFFFRKRKGRFNGWLGYTLAWSWRQFDDLNQGDPFFGKYDRRHDFELAAFYKFNDKWSFSAVLVFATGNTLTLPEGRVPIDIETGQGVTWASDYNQKNGFRMPAYHRLDLGLHKHKQHEKFKSEFHLDIYNVYNRRNPFFVYLSSWYDPRSQGSRIAARQVSLLPMIPSVSYSLTF
jgi:hypothetical protein